MFFFFLRIQVLKTCEACFNKIKATKIQDLFSATEEQKTQTKLFDVSFKVLDVEIWSIGVTQRSIGVT